MKIVITSDFSGYVLKEAVKEYLVGLGHEVVDLGPESVDDKVLYPAAGSRMGKAIQDKVAEKGILICGTGGGVSVVANRYQGVYCIACESKFTAARISVVNNANVLAMGANVVGPGNAFEIVDEFINSHFCMGCDEDRTKFLTGMFEDVQQIEREVR